jgi:hypothetical protein
LAEGLDFVSSKGGIMAGGAGLEYGDSEDVVPESVMPFEDVDVEADVQRFGAAPEGSSLTPEERADVRRQVTVAVAPGSPADLN